MTSRSGAPRNTSSRGPADADQGSDLNGRIKKQLWDRARHLRREGPWLARKYRDRLKEPVLWSLGDRLRSLDAVLKAGRKTADWPSFRLAVAETDQLIEQHLGFARKSDTRRNAEAIGAALFIALFIRAFMFEPYRIPSGSMIPTLLVGDYLFVAKFAYGLKIPYTDTVIFDWRKPKKGEVVIFEHPKPEENREILIKRVMAEPGDRVKLQDNVWYINGEPWGEPKVINRAGACSLSPSQECWTITTGEGGSARRSPGCPCEFFELSDGTKTWVTQHVSPDTLCECTVPEESASCIPFVGGTRDVPPGARSVVANTPSWPNRRDDEFLRGWPWDGSRGKGLIKDLESGREMVVPDGHVMVLGDNRDNSADSRYWGLVPMNLVRGKALFIWLNTSHPSRMFHSVH